MWTEADGRRSEPRGGDEYVFDGQTLTHFYQGVQDPLFLFAYQVDATALPKTIDLRFEEMDPPLLGLYELSGDRLTICFRRPAEVDRRPEDLNSKPGSGRSVLVFERQK